MAQELEQPASDPDFLPSEAVITTKARVNVCRDAIFIILKRVAFLVGHSLLLCCALPSSALPTWVTTTYIHIYYQQNAGTYKNDSYYQKMYTICLSKYCAILLSYCLDWAFLLDFIDSTWILKTSWIMQWPPGPLRNFAFGPCFTILQIANFESK